MLVNLPTRTCGTGGEGICQGEEVCAGIVLHVVMYDYLLLGSVFYAGGECIIIILLLPVSIIAVLGFSEGPIGGYFGRFVLPI